MAIWQWFWRCLRVGSMLTAALLGAAASGAATRTNVLWIYIDDQSPWFSSYGDRTVQTPNLDRLAAEGVLFERAYAPTPVCSPTRSGIITGSYPIRIGAHDHRSGRVPEHQITLPDGIVTVPELFGTAGYETYNATKDDYNFSYRRSDLYSLGSGDIVMPAMGTSKAASGKAEDPSRESAKRAPALARGDQSWKGPSGGGHWTDVPAGRPFFGQMAVSGGKGTGTLTAQLEAAGSKPVDPDTVRVPPQYPDIAQVRGHIATHYNAILRTDVQIGQLVDRLKTDGLWNDTVIFLFSDHGSDLPRSKEFVYHEGLHVPLIVVAPGLADVVKPGTRRRDIVDLLDVAATSLALAGLPVPEFMDARNLFDPAYHREYVFSSADRMSNVIDRSRSVMGERYHYIRNFMLDRPLYNWGHREMIALANPEASSFLSIRALAEQGALTTAQAAPYGKRVAEELYDLKSDPDEVINLAGDPAYAEVLDEMRGALDRWIEDTDDKGQYPRSAAAMEEITGRYPKTWLQSPEFKDP